MKTKKNRNVNRLPQRTAIASAVMLAFVTPAAMAQYKPNVEVYVKPGSERNYLGIDGLVPLVENGTSLFFADAKAHFITESSANEVNLGLGYRAFTEDQQWAWGVYGAFDYKNTKYDNNFNQITVGAEMRSREWDFRANYYQILTDKKLVGLGATNHFAGYGVWRNGVYEEGLSGFDVEVGRLLDLSDRYDVRAYLAGYSFKSKEFGAHDDGVRARLEIRPQKNFSLGVSLQHDSLFGSVGFVEMRYAFGQSSEKGVRTLGERMTDPWKRDQDIVTSGAIESEKSGNSIQTSDQVVHINSSVAENGDGSYERPYKAVGDCNGGKCWDASDSGAGRYNLIRLWQGNSLSTSYAPMRLLDGQTLWGEGADLFSGRTQPGLYPVIGVDSIDFARASAMSVMAPPSAGVTLASGGTLGNTVTGVKIVGTGSGISGENVGGKVKIDRNIIDVTDGYGVRLENYDYDFGDGVSENQTISITGNHITTTSSSDSGYGGYGGYGGGDGIFIGNFVNDNVDFKQAVTISGNTITAVGTGIHLNNYVNNRETLGNRLNQTAVISGNTIGADEDGILLRNNAEYDAATITQIATISGNSISSGRNGVNLYSYADDQGILRQSVEVSGNTIAAARYGVYVGSVGDEEADRIQSVTIANNDINFGDTGIYAENSADGLGTSSLQALTIVGNTLSADPSLDEAKEFTKVRGPRFGYLGISLQNSAGTGYYGGAGSAIQTASISGNTITADGGIGASNYAGGDKISLGTANQTLTISGNTANVGLFGVYLTNFAEAGTHSVPGTATQNATISGNTLSATEFGRAGIAILNRDDGNHDAVQTVVVSGSNAVSGFKYGVAASSDGDHPASRQTVAVSGLSVTPGALATSDSAIVKCHSGSAVQSVLAGSGNTLSGARVGAVTDILDCYKK